MRIDDLPEFLTRARGKARFMNRLSQSAIADYARIACTRAYNTRETETFAHTPAHSTTWTFCVQKPRERESYIYIHIYTCTYIYALLRELSRFRARYIHIHIYIYIYIYMYIYTYTHTHTHTHTTYYISRATAKDICPFVAKDACIRTRTRMKVNRLSSVLR